MLGVDVFRNWPGGILAWMRKPKTSPILADECYPGANAASIKTFGDTTSQRRHSIADMSQFLAHRLPRLL